MKLYTTETSPFGASVKIQIYNKELPVEVLPPHEKLGGDELQVINPTGVTPVLEADGLLIPQ